MTLKNFSLIFIFLGSLFIFLASLGVLRFPDIFTRLHASSKGLIFGLVTILSGVCLNSLDISVLIKSLFIGFFLVITSPLTGHLIGKVANSLREIK